MIAERVVGGVHALLGEQLADQTLTRDDAIRTQKQQGEQRPLFRPTDRKLSPVNPHGERAEDPKVETLAAIARGPVSPTREVDTRG